MPELPEVETVRRGLERLVVGRKIVSVDVRVPKMIKTDLTAFETDIIGQTFQSIGRRGKYLLLNLDRQVIISHLRMEGKYLLLRMKCLRISIFILSLNLIMGRPWFIKMFVNLEPWICLTKNKWLIIFVKENLVLNRQKMILIWRHLLSS